MFNRSLDIVCVTETWLSKNIFNNEILPCGYKIYRSDSESRGGGVLIGISDKIPSKLAWVRAPPEVCLVELNLSPALFLCCVYLAPNSDNSHRMEVTFLRTLSTCKNLIIVGDFNMPDIN